MSNQQQIEKVVVLNQKSLETIEGMLADAPTKFGLPVLEFLKYLFQQQNPQTTSSEAPVVELPKD